jgi:hypothetical protein
MQTTLAEIVNRLRTEFLDDAIAAEEADYQWQSAAIVSAITSAHRELAKRLLLIKDSSTPETCNIEITAGTDGLFPQTVAISPKVLRVDRLKFPGVTKPLKLTSQGELDAFDSGWDEMTGTPELFFVSPAEGTITFNRRPMSGGTVTMTVRRLPLQNFTVGGLTSSSPEKLELFGFDDEVCHGALKYLYLRDDKKTFDPTRANVWSNQFEEDIRQIIRKMAAISPEVFVSPGGDW